MAKRIALALLILLLAFAGYLAAAFFGALGKLEHPGEISTTARPAEITARQTATQRSATSAIGASESKQILFGDLHVHSTYSMDAFLTSLPVMQGEGAHPPADACDFARYCSALDFYSLNDHAEGLTPSMWSEIKSSIRQCNAVAGNSDSPDIAAFLGWEWTQMASTPAEHYGHKNVVLLDTEEHNTPTRPIAALGDAYRIMRNRQGNVPMLGLALRDWTNRQRYFDFLTLRAASAGTPVCELGVPVRDLPLNCSEAVATPRELFEKLDEWGYPAIVIPHGNAWGNTSPARIDWEKQLAAGNHDPARQTLIEVYSGHGSSEVYRPWRHVERNAAGALSCPTPTAGFEPECHRAGEIIRDRCLADGGDTNDCNSRASVARENYARAGRAGSHTVPGETAEDWLDSGQCTDCFNPAFQFRPGGSTQHALAVSSKGVPNTRDDPKQRFRFGLIASSDNHTARPASGYKEFRASGMTDVLHADGSRELRSLLPVDREAKANSIEINADDVVLLPGGDERLSSFFYTGGLVAVHAEGRDRRTIWDALKRKEVYGTSGPRILLWFELLNGPDGSARPMGSEVQLNENPRFRVRAVGSREQQPGCPAFIDGALSPERLQALCMGECHNPGETRRLIERIEVVRIRPRIEYAENIAELVEDVWKGFDCAPNQAGCVFEFDDPDFLTAGRDSVYYVRALEAPALQVNGDPLRCKRDDSGACISTRVCRPGGVGADADECLDLERARAWSSPIFVDRS